MIGLCSLWWLWGLLPALGADVPTDAELRALDVLVDGPTVVRCGHIDGGAWCHADAVLPGTVAEVEALLVDVDRIPELFPRMTSMRVVSPGVLHQVIDYPFPYADRDVVARFTWTGSGGTRSLEWVSIDAPSVPTAGVRLTEAAGRFSLSPGTAGTTRLSYTWRGDLGPGIPDWVEPLAWRGQAEEVVGGFTQALSD